MVLLSPKLCSCCTVVVGIFVGQGQDQPACTAAAEQVIVQASLVCFLQSLFWGSPPPPPPLDLTLYMNMQGLGSSSKSFVHILRSFLY
jgi:hypothetical protein